ncbi:MAG: M43 family zinc metalloprotease [Chitinophagales bacterium]
MKYTTLLLAILLTTGCGRFVIRYAEPADVLHPDIPAQASACSDASSYLPDTTNLRATPIKYVRVNFHIMQRLDGSSNFSEAQGIKFIHDLVQESNNRWANNAHMNLPAGNNTPVIPTQVRIELVKDPYTGKDAIYFHRNDSLCFFNKKASRGYTALADKTVINTYHVGGDSVINIFLMEHVPDSTDSPTYGGPQLSGVSFIGDLKLFGMFYQSTTVKYRDDGTPFVHDMHYLSKLLNHELGHSLGLHHTWNWNDGCDDTPQNPGCWSNTGVPPCDGLISNNMMDYNFDQQAITPCQIATMQWYLYRDDQPVRKFAIPYWCDYHPDQKVYISANAVETWDGGKDLWSDIILRPGSVLIIRCTVALPAEAKVVIKPGAKLILDGGTITNRCGDSWDGIEIWHNRKTDETGSLIMVNGGHVDNAEHFVEVAGDATEE